ncbi:MAG: DUF5110 domain-containing protein, partial [Anaerolineae bacterium]|nr:DUF5110 domain-containing protein [Anaerolineae bacterium]
MNLHRYGVADGEFTLYEDDGSSNAYVNGEHAQTIIRAVG